MLTHALIPHHHHNGISFLSDIVYQDHDDAHENCLLSKIYLRLSYDEQRFELHDCDFDLLPSILALFSDYIAPQTNDDAYLILIPKPYIRSCHTEFIARLTGLRAPPY